MKLLFIEPSKVRASSVDKPHIVRTDLTFHALALQVVLLQVPEETLRKRILGRRMDPETGKIYHLDLNPVPEGEEQEAITARLVQRDDDTEEALEKRLASYRETVAAISAAYPRTRVIDGDRPPPDVSADIMLYLSAQ